MEMASLLPSKIYKHNEKQATWNLSSLNKSKLKQQINFPPPPPLLSWQQCNLHSNLHSLPSHERSN